MAAADSGSSRHGLPDVVMRHIDNYVDSLAPQIQPRIASEIETFQQKTIDSLEDHVIDAFRSLFRKDKVQNDVGSRNLDDAPPDAYGGQSLPFADEIAKLTRGFNKLSDEASDDLSDIFNITEGSGSQQSQSRGFDSKDAFSQGAKGFLSAALNAVQDHMDANGQGGGKRIELEGLLGTLSSTIKDAARNPEDKARAITPEIRHKVAAKLREQHAPIAEQFTRIALDHIKRWLRGNTTTRELGDGVKGEIEDHVKDLVKGIGGLFGHKKHDGEGASRGLDHHDDDRDGGNEGSGGGFSKLISDKLSTGLAKVHRSVRLEFRTVLGAIEKQLFELLPDEFQRPLEKILGGNPFDSQLDRSAETQSDRGFGDDIKFKLVRKIRDLVRKVQDTLRESILGVVNGGHRRFERQSWVFVQHMVEGKVQKFLPKVRITVPDDIGNEGVSVGAPAVLPAPSHQPSAGIPPQGSYAPPPSHNPGEQAPFSNASNPMQYQQASQEYHSYQYQQPGQHEQFGQHQQTGQYQPPNQYQQPGQHQQPNQYQQPSQYQQSSQYQTSDYRPSQHHSYRQGQDQSYNQRYDRQ